MVKKDKHIYSLELTERQARLLSWACNMMARIIQGQDWAYQEFMESAWEKRAKEATGNSMDKEFEGGWYKMRNDAEELCKQMKKRFWNCDANAMYGIHYDDTADILFALHTVIRHQIWLDGDRQFHGVDSDKPTQLGTEPLAVMRRTDVSSDEIMKDMNKLYADIESCIMQLIHGRAENEKPLIANAQHKMESLMVATQQKLRVIADYLTNKD